MSRPASGDFFLVTCEHGGNRIPARYRDLFPAEASILRTHRGYDMGALRVARDMAAALRAPLHAATISRLLIDLNRSPRHPKLYSEFTRGAPPAIRHEIKTLFHAPYRAAAEARIEKAIAEGRRVIHVSCHSFTPALNGEVRNADVGLLYDPARRAETALCRRWKAALQARAPALKTRMNYPYAGTDDGFTVALRRRFSEERYVGIELEINQCHAAPRGKHWNDMRGAVIAALRDAMGMPENQGGIEDRNRAEKGSMRIRRRRIHMLPPQAGKPD
ncbi:MAG: N-formylglutamate amidohydrolase [Noviherbaspirillum sp.]|nr:N-formylglutamate amidohydrolase [Noviherbaspirillum sp.]